MKLDSIDKAILQALKKNARMSINDIAAKVGLSPTPCGRRIKNMEDGGVIRRYTIDVDDGVFGMTVEALICVRLNRQTKDSVPSLTSQLARMQEVVECMLVTGEFDFIIRVKTQGPEGLRFFITDKLNKLESISQTVSMIVLKNYSS